MGYINNWDSFEEKFLKFIGEDKTLNTLINDLSNLKVKPNEKFNEFNSKFNKPLNKILGIARPSEKV